MNFKLQNSIFNRQDLENMALKFGILPFFRNNIPGFSIEEMAAPGRLFGGFTDDDGCWEWKGPVIQEQTTAYGKLFNRKAGFIACDLLNDFINYRRSIFPVKRGSTEEMILDIIKENEGLSSTQLKEIINGKPARKRSYEDLASLSENPGLRKKSLEGPLQRLQMGGHLIIVNFEYKYTRAGERYGWGVAVYSTPEIWFEKKFLPAKRTPEESLNFLLDNLTNRIPFASREDIFKLIK